jgi:outer membrane protein assembly factor BamA
LSCLVFHTVTTALYQLDIISLTLSLSLCLSPSVCLSLSLPLVRARPRRYLRGPQSPAVRAEAATRRCGWRRSDAHELAYELGLRSVTPLSLMASKAVEKFRGPSLKSAVKHSFLLDRRDNPLDPSAGYVVRSTSEVAGLGPLSANLLRYARTEVAAAATVPLSELVGLKLAASLGVLVPWGKDWASQSTSVADRMFVGGPESIRGFRSR